MKKYITTLLVSSLLLLGSLNVVIWQEVVRKERQPEIVISFFNVGQGDSEFIEAKDGTQILIDGGPDNKILSLLASRMPLYDRTLDAIILTHPHADHITGLAEVLKTYDVGMVIESGVVYHTPEADAFYALVAQKHIREVIVDRPMALTFFGGARISFLGPIRSFEGKEIKKVHDSMLVSLLAFEGKKVLFMGDSEKSIEHGLAAQRLVGPVDILKVGHHGSKTSSNKEFLSAVKPSYAVIEVGKNSYGHPAFTVLSGLAAAGAKVFRTDLNGTVQASIDRGILRIVAEK